MIQQRMAIEGRMSPLCFLAFVFALIAAAKGYGQTPPGGGQVSTPQSSIEKPADTGVRAHTNIQIHPQPGAGRGARAAGRHRYRRLPDLGSPLIRSTPSQPKRYRQCTTDFPVSS